MVRNAKRLQKGNSVVKAMVLQQATLLLPMKLPYNTHKSFLPLSVKFLETRPDYDPQFISCVWGNSGYCNLAYSNGAPDQRQQHARLCARQRTMAANKKTTGDSVGA